MKRGGIACLDRILVIRLLGCAALLAALGAGAAQPEDRATTSSPQPLFKIIGYVNGGMDFARIDATKLTHINYAFAEVNAEGQLFFRRANAGANLAALRELKKKNPDLKILVSVGGWGADNFSDAALTDASREKFAQSAARLITEHALDGIDLDWEYPGQRGPGIKFRAEDKENFTRLLKEVRGRLDALSDEQGRTGGNRFLLTIASSGSQSYFDHTEMDKLHAHLDFINVMTYDLFGSGSKTTGHHTGLYPSANPNVQERTSVAGIERHLKAGIPAKKIVLGVAFYGRAWAGAAPENNGLNQPYERFVSAFPYSRLADEYIGKGGFTRHWDDAAKAPYLWNPQSRTFISYDDPESLKHKTAFVREKGLGGIMYWQHAHDPGETLLRAVHDNLRTDRTTKTATEPQP